MRLYLLHGLTVLSTLMFAGSSVAEDPTPTPTAVPAATIEVEPIDTSSTDDAEAKTRVVEWLTSYNAARKQGTDSKRPVMLFVTMEKCRYCVRMNNESFRHEAVVKEIVDSFVPVKLYLDPESKLGKNLKITIFPTTMVIAPDGTILEYIRGYVPREEFETKLLAAKDAHGRQMQLADATEKPTTK